MNDYRKIARDLLVFFGLSPNVGRALTDPVYARGIIEGRRYKPPSSSCGDVGQCLLYRVGIREAWINRAEHDGWHFGEYRGGAWDNNITTLCGRHAYGVNPYAIRPPVDAHFEAGDILVVATDNPMRTHATCVIEHDPDTGHIVTCDGGQPHVCLYDSRLTGKPKTPTAPGNPISKRPTGKHGALELWRGTSRVDSWLPLLKAIEGARGKGLLAAPETAEDYAERFSQVTQPETPHSLSPTPTAHRRVLVRGMYGEDVKEWQAQLRKDGWAIGVDGHFGMLTAGATIKWQAAHGLEPDGVVGPKTRAEIGKPPKRSSSAAFTAIKPEDL